MRCCPQDTLLIDTSPPPPGGPPGGFLGGSPRGPPGGTLWGIPPMDSPEDPPGVRWIAPGMPPAWPEGIPPKDLDPPEGGPPEDPLGGSSLGIPPCRE